MKSISKKSRLNRSQYEVDMDPYSTSILEELLENNQEWNGSDEIIKLTFRAISDILQIHGQSIKDIKSVLTTRASKAELTTGLSLKANINDISETIDEISSQIEERPSYSELNSILKSYLHRNEMSKALAQINYDKNVQTCQPSIQNRGKQRFQNEDERILNQRLEDIEKLIKKTNEEVEKKLQNCVTLNQFQQALTIIDAKANFKDVQEALQELITQEQTVNLLGKKVNKTQLEIMLEKKADVNDLEYIITSLQSKVSLNTLEKLTQVIQNKADKSDIAILMNERHSSSALTRSHNRSYYEQSSQKLEQFRNQIEKQLQEIRKKLQPIAQSFESLPPLSLNEKMSLLTTTLHEELNMLKISQNKAFSQQKLSFGQDINSLKHRLRELSDQISNQKDKNRIQTLNRELINECNMRKRCQQKIYQQIDQMRKKVDEMEIKCFQKGQVYKIRNQLMEIINTKIDDQALGKGLTKVSEEICGKFQQDNETNTLLLEKLQKTYSEAISVNSEDILKLNKLIGKKQDKYQYALIEQNNRKSRQQIQQCRKTVDKTYEQLQGKLSILEYENDLKDIKKRFDKLTAQLENKANIKDVCVLVDSKPNIDDVNNALKELNQVLNEKVTQTQLQAILKDQSSINQTLCSENIVGRWMWQTGQLKAGGLIPWEVESANTVPEHFYWEKDKTSILILVSGIYQIKGCIFSKNANISILVNGQGLLQGKGQENFNTLNTRTKSQSQVTKKKYKGKQTTGQKVEHFVILPARSRVSMVCLGDPGEGFLNIKRL